jgi:hypothetical protein
MRPVKKISSIFNSCICTWLPSCQDAARLQSEALDKKLSFPKRFGLFLHLLVCKWCRRYGKQIRFLGHAAHNHSENLSEAVPQKLSAEARERIKKRLQGG